MLEHLLLSRNILGEARKRLVTLAVVCDVEGMEDRAEEARALIGKVRTAIASADALLVKQ
jgi:hypothetical protein